MTVLVDSSVWIDYFRGSEKVDMLDLLIEENLLAINDLILAELVPYLRIKRQRKLLLLLQEIRRIPLKIDWEEIVEMQIKCIRTGINKVGIPICSSPKMPFKTNWFYTASTNTLA
jgi:predicted nucleic acid-binding protein